VKGKDAFFAAVEEVSEVPHLLADSGAFSAWNSGQKIDLAAYARFLAAEQEWIFMPVNLDVIAGTEDEWPTPNACEHASIQGYENWLELRRLGVETMPVYHQDDASHWLYRYLEEGAVYIGVSPNKSYPAAIWQRWMYNVLWELDKSGGLNRDFFTHGFGVFAPTFLPQLRERMWSADATNMMRFTTMRRILLPLDESGTPTMVGPLTRLPAVYVGRLPNRAPKNVDWKAVADYLRALSVDQHYFEQPCGRLVAKNLRAIASVNIHAMRVVMRTSGVRIFIAGFDHRVLYQISQERYPYVLRSFAHLSEQDTLRDLYFRNLRPPRRK